MTELSRQEFHDAINLIRQDIRGIHARLDLLNGRTREAEQQVAVLTDRGHPAAWGGGIGAVVVGIIEAVRWMMKH